MIRNARRAIRALALLLRRRSWGPFVEAAEESSFDHGFTISWSQAGEDIALLLMLSDIAGGRYIDIGAHHPSRFSVTRKLYQRGWTGVNVDANRELVHEFGEIRPRDINISAAVGEQSKYEFTVFTETAISTVEREWEKRFLDQGQTPLRREVVSGVTLRKLLDDFFPDRGPDLLSIDIEGADLEALRSGDLGSLPASRRPLWLLLETSPPVASSLETPAVVLATQLGYEPMLVLPMATLLRRRPE